MGGGDDDGGDGGDDDRVMVDLETYERLERERAENQPVVDPESELVPKVPPAKLKELKQEAHRKIEDRLVTRRRKRRLLKSSQIQKVRREDQS